MRVSLMAFPGIAPQWQQIIVFVSIASMALGAFAAIGQRNIKRLMAYSSIGHMGFALIGLAAGTSEGRTGRSRLYGDLCGDDARDFRLHHRHAPRRRRGREHFRPRRARPHASGRWPSSLRCCCSRLPGVPPLAGFFAKFYVFLAAIQAGLFTLAVLGVLASVVGVLLLSDDRQNDVFRRAGAEPSIRWATAASRWRLGVAGAVRHLVLRLSWPAGRRRRA